VSDPFRPPEANVDLPDVERGSAVKAVVLGALVDLGGSIVASIVFFALYGVYLGATGTQAEELQSTMSSMNGNSPMGILMNIVGCLFSVLGGYVCARIAKHSEYRLGAILAAISVVLGLLVASSEEANAMIGIYSLLTLAAVLVGAHLGSARNRRDRAGRNP
jgi:hypothetical protein